MPKIAGISRALAAPGASADGTDIQVRVDQFGAQHVRGELLAWMEDATYFKACNATWGTGIGMAIQTSFSDTANVLVLLRSGSATKAIIPHYIRLINTVAGATTTSSHMGIILDTGNRYSSGGTDLSAQVVSPRSDSGATTVLDQIRFAAITASAVVVKRQIARFALKTQAAPCWAVGDEVLINFLHNEGSQHGLLSGAAAGSIVKNVGPMMLKGLNHCLLVHMWNPANATTAPSWEVEMAWWERPFA